MSSLPLAQAELLKVGPVASRHSLRLLPLSKKKKKVGGHGNGKFRVALISKPLCHQQKFVVGDEYGVVSSFQMKRGEPQAVYKTIALGNPIACVHMGTSKGTEDKAYVSTAQNIYGFNKKGKEFFKFQSNLAESITKIYTYDSKLWTATDYTYNQYDNGADKASFVSPDKINDMLIVNVSHEQDFFAVLGCQDRYLRVIGRDGTLVTKKSVAAPVTALTRVAHNKTTGPAEIVYGTATGAIGLVTFNGEKLKTKWKASALGEPEDSRAQTSTSSSTAAINSITCFDINKDGHPEIVIGRDDGRVEVYAYDQDGEVSKLFENVSTDSVRCVQGGIVSTPGYEEVIATTFSGRVMSFTTEPLDQPDAEDSYGRTRGTVQRETRIVKLRKDIAQLEEKLAREKERATKSRWSEKDFLPVAEDLVVNHKFQLNPTIGAYDVSIEVPMNIQSVVLHSAVPIDLLENDRNLAIVGKSPGDPQNNTHFLATYRCLEPTNRLEFNIRTIEGQFGDVEATVITDGSPKAAHTIKFYVKPLSLHHRVNVVDENELKGQTNSLHFSGGFTLLQMHEWISLCLPEVPSRLQEEDVVMYYKNTYIGNLLVCRYRKGEATFTSASVSVIAILKEVITKEATVRKVSINLSLDVKKETIPVILGYLRPLLDSKHALASQVKLIDSIKELQMHEDDYAAWMAPDYQLILSQGEKIMKDFKASPKALNYLAGILTDLYVDLCKFRGTNVKQNLPHLYQLIEQYHFDSLVDFYLKE